ncbi:MAG: hypothetical protein LBV45_11290, partial [Xanthomonadaceae bacterium]|nr:hypothetical protein [Xanthomonadaceae bacterium]
MNDWFWRRAATIAAFIMAGGCVGGMAGWVMTGLAVPGGIVGGMLGAIVLLVRDLLHARRLIAWLR